MNLRRQPWEVSREREGDGGSLVGQRGNFAVRGREGRYGGTDTSMDVQRRPGQCF